MAVVTFTLTDVDEKFAEMIKRIHMVYSKRIKCGIDINLSGKPTDFNYKYHSIDPLTLYNIQIEEDCKNNEQIL